MRQTERLRWRAKRRGITENILQAMRLLQCDLVKCVAWEKATPEYPRKTTVERHRVARQAYASDCRSTKVLTWMMFPVEMAASWSWAHWMDPSTCSLRNPVWAMKTKGKIKLNLINVVARQERLTSTERLDCSTKAYALTIWITIKVDSRINMR